MAEDIRHTPQYRDIYKLRQQKIERVFADAKEKHGMRYTQYRGLAQVTNWVKLKFAAMNLKKLPHGSGKPSIHPHSGRARGFALQTSASFSCLFSHFAKSLPWPELARARFF